MTWETRACDREPAGKLLDCVEDARALWFVRLERIRFERVRQTRIQLGHPVMTGAITKAPCIHCIEGAA